MDLFFSLARVPTTLTDVAGLVPGADANTTDLICCGVWNAEYENAKQSNLIVTSLSKVSTYSSAQVAAVTGLLQTMKALNFMYLAETRDTLRIPLYAIDHNPTDAPFCNKDVWAYIVALLDSGFESAGHGGGRLRYQSAVPAGFAAGCANRLSEHGAGVVRSVQSGSGRQGRAGAGVRHCARHGWCADARRPAGSPNAAALLRADSALTASALLQPDGDQTAGGRRYFPLDANGVYHTFSGASGDQVGPVNGNCSKFVTTFDFTNDVDT